MMGMDYRTYLAAKLLSEDRVITYRILSRAAKVHVNTAKEMLFEFHKHQNARKPGTIYATYLVAGNKRRQSPARTNGRSEKDGEDEHMYGSPVRNSPVPPPDDRSEECPVLSITLVNEENLEEICSLYETITSIHVYSIALHSLKDLQILASITREALERDVEQEQDALEGARTYSTIRNRAARRRDVRRVPASMNPNHTPALERLLGSVTKESDKNGTSKPSIFASSSSNAGPDTKLSQPSNVPQNKGSLEKKNISNNPAQLRYDSSSIFKSFAKAKPKLEREGNNSFNGASGLESAPPSEAEDEPMKDTSEEEEQTYTPSATAYSNAPADAARKSREEREAALKKMMEEDDKDEQDQVAMDNPNSQFTPNDTAASHVTEETVQVTDGRRRGRRRVIRKKTLKDEEGYLVTREEPAWELFSEDEPTAKPKLPASIPPSSEKSKKGASKPGQGSIMSFFGKN